MNADVHALAGPYALHALPADEAELFELHLRDCASCRQEVEELRATAARLGATTATPPPDGLKPRVLAEVGRTRQLPPELPARPVRLWRRRNLLAAAAVTVLTGGGVAAGIGFGGRDEEAAERMAAVIGAPDAHTVRGKVTGGGRVTLVVSEREASAVVVMNQVPAAPDGRTYQMWLMHGDTPRSAGTVDVSRSGRAARVLERDVVGADGFGLTVEPAGGSEAPTSPIIAELPLSS